MLVHGGDEIDAAVRAFLEALLGLLVEMIVSNGVIGRLLQSGLVVLIPHSDVGVGHDLGGDAVKAVLARESSGLSGRWRGDALRRRPLSAQWVALVDDAVHNLSLGGFRCDRRLPRHRTPRAVRLALVQHVADHLPLGELGLRRCAGDGSRAVGAELDDTAIQVAIVGLRHEPLRRSDRTVGVDEIGHVAEHLWLWRLGVILQNLPARFGVNARCIAGRPNRGSRWRGSGVQPASHALHVRVGLGSGDKPAAQSGEPFALADAFDQLSGVRSTTNDQGPESGVGVDLRVVHSLGFRAHDAGLGAVAPRIEGRAWGLDGDGHGNGGVEGGGTSSGRSVLRVGEGLLFLGLDRDEAGVGDRLVAAGHAKPDFGREGSGAHLPFGIAEGRLREDISEAKAGGAVRVVCDA